MLMNYDDNYDFSPMRLNFFKIKKIKMLRQG